MAWNQPTTNSENLNKKTEKETKPKSVKFACFCCVLLVLQGLLLGTFSYLFPEPYGYNPWTVGVGYFTWCIVAFNCGVAIEMRNMIAAVFAIFVQFVVGWVLFDGLWFSMAASGVPLLLLLLPQSRRWLKVNSHLNKIRAIVWAIVSVLIVGVGVMIAKSSVVTEKYISNKNPIWVFKPGDKPIHPFNKPNAHVYDYWQDGYLLGNCLVTYNRHNICREVILGISNRFSSKDPADYNYFQQKLKDECERRFDYIEWTVSEADTGFPSLKGKTSNRTMIEIYCPDIDSVYCFLVVYDPHLLDYESKAAHKKDKPSSYGEALDSLGIFYHVPYKNPLAVR